MSVLIRGMEMPKSCGECKAFVCYRQWSGDLGDCFCGITKNDAKADARNADCTLVEIPPHGRLIDADALHKQLLLMEYIRDNAWQDGRREANGVDAARMTLLDAPTIIEGDEE